MTSPEIEIVCGDIRCLNLYLEEKKQKKGKIHVITTPRTLTYKDVFKDTDLFTTQHLSSKVNGHLREGVLLGGLVDMYVKLKEKLQTLKSQDIILLFDFYFGIDKNFIELFKCLFHGIPYQFKGFYLANDKEFEKNIQLFHHQVGCRMFMYKIKEFKDDNTWEGDLICLP